MIEPIIYCTIFPFCSCIIHLSSEMVQILLVSQRSSMWPRRKRSWCSWRYFNVNLINSTHYFGNNNNNLDYNNYKYNCCGKFYSKYKPMSQSQSHLQGRKGLALIMIEGGRTGSMVLSCARKWRFLRKHKQLGAPFAVKYWIGIEHFVLIGTIH